MQSIFWSQFLWIILGLLIGLVAGYFIARHVFTKQLKENPPVSEKMIRAMFLQMGRKASEKQIKEVMKSMKQY